MSRAVICDKCGLAATRITDGDFGMNPIWLKNPFLYSKESLDSIAAVHLCDECYEQFKTTFLENLSEEELGLEA